VAGFNQPHTPVRKFFEAFLVHTDFVTGKALPKSCNPIQSKIKRG